MASPTIETLRKRLNQLKTGRKSSDFWRPEVGMYHVRTLPWPDQDAMLPFKEREFYYELPVRSVPTLAQFGKPDPVQELIASLYDEGTEEAKALAKKLRPGLRAFVPIIVRGKEDEGVKLWSLNYTNYQELLGHFTNEDYIEDGDRLMNDPLVGHDFTVDVSQPEGRRFPTTKTTPRPKSSPLSDDKKKTEAWLKSVPDLDEIYPVKSYEELKEIMDRWLAGDDSTPGTAREGGKVNDEVTSDTSSDSSDDDEIVNLDEAFASLE